MTGGASVFSLDLCELLVEHGFTPLLIHGCDSDSVENYCIANNIHHFSMPSLSNKLNFIDDFCVVLQMFKIISANPLACIVLNSAKAALLGRIVCTLLSRKCIYIVHGWPYTGWLHKPYRLIFFWIELIADAIFAVHTSFVYVSRYDMKQRPFSFFNLFNPRRGVVIHNSTARIYTEASACVSSLSHSSRLEVVTVSRLEAQKDVASLIKAVALLPQFSLTVIGTGPQKNKLLSLAHRLNVSDRISFLGALPRNEVKHKLQQANIFALISNWEGFPISTVEAMSCSLPVIVSDVGGAAEVFDFAPHLSFGCRISHRNRVDHIVAALKKYLVEETLRDHSANAFFVYSNFLSRRQFVSKYMSRLSTLID